VIVYLDASVILPLFLKDSFSGSSKQLVSAGNKILIVSDWANLEVTSIVKKASRAGTVTETEARSLLSNFDSWCHDFTKLVPLEQSDFQLANDFVRRDSIALLAADALHLAIAGRLGSAVATFDKGMAKAASTIGLPLAN
jgi:uncharacterized protein